MTILADLSPLITDRFHVDRSFVTSALLEGIISPADLDPTCSAQLDGFADALRAHPDLPTSDALLARMKAQSLWEFAAIPAVAAHLAAAIRAQDWSADTWESLPHDPPTGFPTFPSTIGRLSQPRPLLPVIQDAFLDHFKRGPLYEPLLHYALSHGWFSPEAETTLARRRRSTNPTSPAPCSRSPSTTRPTPPGSRTASGSKHGSGT